MKQKVVLYHSAYIATKECNKMIDDGWLVKIMIIDTKTDNVIVTFERPLLDTTDTGPR